MVRSSYKPQSPSMLMTTVMPWLPVSLKRNIRSSLGQSSCLLRGGYSSRTARSSSSLGIHGKRNTRFFLMCSTPKDTDPSSFRDAFDWLYSFDKYGWIFGLERITFLLEQLDN